MRLRLSLLNFNEIYNRRVFGRGLAVVLVDSFKGENSREEKHKVECGTHANAKNQPSFG